MAAKDVKFSGDSGDRMLTVGESKLDGPSKSSAPSSRQNLSVSSK